MGEVDDLQSYTSLRLPVLPVYGGFGREVGWGGGGRHEGVTSVQGSVTCLQKEPDPCGNQYEI